MSPLSEVGLVVQRELAKNFRSAKGIVLLVLSLLGGSSIALLTAKYQRFKAENLGDLSAEQLHEVREQALRKLYDTQLAHALADAPEVLLGVLTLTVWLTPMLVALMGFDAIAPDIQHRSVRYWSLRTRRASYFVGKWLGLWSTVSMVTLVMDAFIWTVSIVRGDTTVATTLSWGVRFWLVTLPISAAWCAVATLLSSLFRSPILALLLTFAAFFSLWVVYLIGVAADIEPMIYLYPNHYEEFLLHPVSDKVLTGLGACLAMAAAYVTAGAALFRFRDV